jgi:hypothetical protein
MRFREVLARNRLAIGRGTLVLLAIDALDLTTSLIPSTADAPNPIPSRPGWVYAIQIALAAPLLVLAARRLPALGRWLRALPVPRPALLVLGAFFATELAHVALRFERFPFSPISMFSCAFPPPAEDVVAMPGYFVPGRLQNEVVSFLREGNPIFALHDFGWDYKAGWAMSLYATSSTAARELVFRQLDAEGLPAMLALVGYDRGDGHFVRPPVGP